ncbi:MAG: neutral zinc metallopeptidase [Weeksellaceae bacterium]
MAQWNKILSRGNVEDRRGFSPMIGGISITGVLVLMAVNYLLGGSPLDALQQINNLPQETSSTKLTDEYDGSDEYEVFASSVLGSTNELWTAEFASQGQQYTEPKLVLFRTGTESGCGGASSEYGPHYCPIDQTIYIDETFFDELTSRLGAEGGDVAEAYVIAHEVGHHVQNQLQDLNQRDSNEESIAVELQADCYAGLWANSLRDAGIFEPGEIAEAMDAAAAVGDDRIQERVTGEVNPETWTHGSSEQRQAWFSRGYESGDFAQCDTSN